jgi:hypothetical protein
LTQNICSIIIDLEAVVHVTNTRNIFYNINASGTTRPTRPKGRSAQMSANVNPILPNAGTTAGLDDTERVVIEIKFGPDPAGPQLCLHCHQTFAAEDSWQMFWDPEMDYAIGLHSRCIAVTKSESQRDALAA